MAHSKMRKEISDLTVADLKRQPVWRFVSVSGTEVAPVETLPPRSFDSLIIGAEVQLADESWVWALLQNFSLSGSAVNDHFLNLTFDIKGSWFVLARYHDPWIESHGPQKLAQLLDRSLEQVFPIRFDLRKALKSFDLVFVGEVQMEPDVKLTRDQIMQHVLG